MIFFSYFFNNTTFDSFVNFSDTAEFLLKVSTIFWKLFKLFLDLIQKFPAFFVEVQCSIFCLAIPDKNKSNKTRAMNFVLIVKEVERSKNKFDTPRRGKGYPLKTALIPLDRNWFLSEGYRNRDRPMIGFDNSIELQRIAIKISPGKTSTWTTEKKVGDTSDNRAFQL